MRQTVKVIKVCQYQFRTLRENYKIYMLPICMFVFLYAAMQPLRDFIQDVDVAATPYLFVFLFSDRTLTALIFAGIVLFFVDAPFYNKSQLYPVIRSEVHVWIKAQILYVFTISFLYIVFIFSVCILFLTPNIEWSLEWGKVWSTLALTDARTVYMLPFSVSQDIIFTYTPLQAVFLGLLMGFLICAFYGFVTWCLNLLVGRIISLVIVLASILLVIRVPWLAVWVTYLSPSAWMDLSGLSEYALHGISVQKAILILITGIIVLCMIAYYKTRKSDLAV